MIQIAQVEGMATPLHHDQPQRALQTLKAHHENPSEHPKSSRQSKSTTSSPHPHHENLAESLYVRSAALRALYHHQQLQQQHLRNRRSGGPHASFEENPPPGLCFPQSPGPSSSEPPRHARRLVHDAHPHARSDPIDQPHTGSHAQTFLMDSAPCYAAHPDAGSSLEGHRHHHAGSSRPAAIMHNDQTYHAGAEEALPSSRHHEQSSDAVKPIDRHAQNARGGECRRQPLQSLVTRNSHSHDYRAVVLLENLDNLALKHHQHVNHDDYFDCIQDDKQKIQSTSHRKLPSKQQQDAVPEYSHTRNTDVSDANAVAEFTEKTNRLRLVEQVAHEGLEENIDAERSSHTEGSFQQLQPELSQCSSDDSFCDISKEAVEQEYQIDCRLSASSEQQQWSLGLVYDYSRAGVTLTEDALKEQQSGVIDSLCNDKDTASNDEDRCRNVKNMHDDAGDHDLHCRDVESPPLFLGFNPSTTRFACGTSKGLHVYDIKSMRELFSCMVGGVGIVELLVDTDVLLLVGGGPNPSFPLSRVVMWDPISEKPIRHIAHSFPIRAVKARKDRLVVVLEHEVHVYNISTAKLLFQLNTISNVKGLCALSRKEGPSVLACPGLKKGEVRIEHIGPNREQGELPTRDSIVISAHDSTLACVALDAFGSLLATASDRGTLIRIFSTKDGAPLQELRRGSDRAEIYSLTFSFSSDWLAVSSDKGTIHVFCIGLRSTDTNGASSISVRNPGSTLSFIKGVLPKYFRSEWSYAQFKLPEETKSVVAFGQEKHTVHVLATDGSLCKYVLDPEHGGDMKQLECWNFMNQRGVKA